MASNLGNKAKKLYFDVALTATNQSFLCTQFAPTTPGDRYGSLLAALENCTGGTVSKIKQSRAVRAYFVPGNAFTGKNMPAVNFVQPTVNGTGKGALTFLPYMTSPGATIAGFAGHEAIYGTAGSVRHFSVLLQASTVLGEGESVNGVLCVERQHSIEV
jgi:hypothetical protein